MRAKAGAKTKVILLIAIPVMNFRIFQNLVFYLVCIAVLGENSLFAKCKNIVPSSNSLLSGVKRLFDVIYSQ